MRRFAVTGVFALIFCLGGASQALGQKMDEAKEHAQRAAAAENSDDWATAATEWGMAFRLSKDPVVFSRIGYAYFRLGDCRAARVYYKRYLKEAKPKERYKKAAERNMGTCQEKPNAAKTPANIDKQKAATPKGPTPNTEKTPPAATKSNKLAAPDMDLGGDLDSQDSDSSISSTETVSGEADVDVAEVDENEGYNGLDNSPSFADKEYSAFETAGWVSVGIFVALGSTAAVLGLSANSRQEDIENLIDFRDDNDNPTPFSGSTKERYEELQSDGKDLDKGAIIFAAAAGVAAATAATFFILDLFDDDKSDDDTTAIAPIVDRNLIGAGARWSF